MTPEKETIVPLSRKKMLLLLLGGGLFVALCAWMLSLDDQTIRTSFRRCNDPLLIHGIGLVGVVFFGLCGACWLRKLFDSKPGLVFTDKGFIDNSSAASVGFVPWSDVTGCHPLAVQSQKFLAVKVTDPEKYIKSCGALKRIFASMNMRMYRTPIVISTSGLAIRFPELCALFDRYTQAKPAD